MTNQNRHGHMFGRIAWLSFVVMGSKGLPLQLLPHDWEKLHPIDLSCFQPLLWGTGWIAFSGQTGM